jgi:hypothetical protein
VHGGKHHGQGTRIRATRTSRAETVSKSEILVLVTITYLMHGVNEGQGRIKPSKVRALNAKACELNVTTLELNARELKLKAHALNVKVRVLNPRTERACVKPSNAWRMLTLECTCVEASDTRTLNARMHVLKPRMSVR